MNVREGGFGAAGGRGEVWLFDRSVGPEECDLVAGRRRAGACVRAFAGARGTRASRRVRGSSGWLGAASPLPLSEAKAWLEPEAAAASRCQAASGPTALPRPTETWLSRKISFFLTCWYGFFFSENVSESNQTAFVH